MTQFKVTFSLSLTQVNDGAQLVLTSGLCCPEPIWEQRSAAWWPVFCLTGPAREGWSTSRMDRRKRLKNELTDISICQISFPHCTEPLGYQCFKPCSLRENAKCQSGFNWSGKQSRHMYRTQQSTYTFQSMLHWSWMWIDTFDSSCALPNECFYSILGI